MDRPYYRFEIARIIGARALQVQLGAPIMIDVPPDMINPVQIAELEFHHGVLPITVLESEDEVQSNPKITKKSDEGKASS